MVLWKALKSKKPRFWRGFSGLYLVYFTNTIALPVEPRRSTKKVKAKVKRVVRHLLLSVSAAKSSTRDLEILQKDK
jgi:hypothetical protein